MAKKKTASINVRNGLMNVSLPAIAAMGGATGNVWLAGAAAIPAALAASGTLQSLLSKKQEEHLELPMPPWWGQGLESWQTACSNVEFHLPEIIEGTVQELRQKTDYPSSARVKQVFVEQVAQRLSGWDVLPQDRYLVAGFITPPLLEKSAMVLKPVIDATREDAIALWLTKVAEALDNIQKSTTTSLVVTSTAVAPTQAGTTIVSNVPAQDSQMIALSLEQKRQKSKYDVYICYDEADETEVRDIGEQLKSHDILPWFDSLDDIEPGKLREFQQEEQIEKIPSATVFVGEHAIASGQALVMYAFIRQFVDRGLPVIPVLLKSAPQKPKLPVFLAGFGWVDFHKQVPEPMGRLLWGITGVRP